MVIIQPCSRQLLDDKKQALLISTFFAVFFRWPPWLKDTSWSKSCLVFDWFFIDSRRTDLEEIRGDDTISLISPVTLHQAIAVQLLSDTMTETETVNLAESLPDGEIEISRLGEVRGECISAKWKHCSGLLTITWHIWSPFVFVCLACSSRLN